MTDIGEPPTRRQEIIAQLMLCVEHPFGGFGQPRGEEKTALLAELLSIPADGPPEPDAPKGTGRKWSADDDRALSIFATCGVGLDETADVLRRSISAIFNRLHALLPGRAAPDGWYGAAREQGLIR